jgi:hypothetical protein
MRSEDNNEVWELTEVTRPKEDPSNGACVKPGMANVADMILRAVNKFKGSAA